MALIAVASVCRLVFVGQKDLYPGISILGVVFSLRRFLSFALFAFILRVSYSSWDYSIFMLSIMLLVRVLRMFYIVALGVRVNCWDGMGTGLSSFEKS